MLVPAPGGSLDVRFLLAPVLAAALVACCGRPDGPAAAPSGAAPAGVAAPSVTAPVRFAGLDDLRSELKARREAGRPVLLNFWATWCEPCIAEMPALEDLAREWSNGGPETIGVSLDAWVFPDEPEAEAKVRDLLARTGVTYTNLIYRGEQDPLLDGFDMPGPIPFSILYDRDGKRIAEYVGPVDVEDLRRAVAGIARPAGGVPLAGGTGP